MRLSYDHGVSSEPLLGWTIDQQLTITAERIPDLPALIVRHQDARYTWRQFKRTVDDYAAGLLAIGLGPGDRLGIWAPNCWEWTVCQFSAARVGLVLVNINPAYRISELEYALNKVGCKALVTAQCFKSSDYLEMLGRLAPELRDSTPGTLAAARLPELRTVLTLGSAPHAGFLGFETLPRLATPADRGRAAQIAATLQFDDPINIQFTSGTTGAPKGATLTHHNILNNGYFNARALNLAPGDKLCIPVPLYHCFGMVMGNLGCVSSGATMVYPAPSFEPRSVLEAVAAERCTALYGVPTMFIAQLEHPDFASFDLSSLRTGTMAGAPCPVQVMERVVRDMHMKDVTIAYGMTETSPVSMQTRAGDPIEKRVSTVGRVHPHVEVKIVDGAGRIVPRGERGEFLTRGYSVMTGYWGDEPRTREAIDSTGWMHTGDLAVMDDDGYVNITGRLKDMIIRGGENVYPREVEEFLFRHPKVQEVQVFGIPDAKFGEVVCAWIRVREGQDATADEIIGHCREQIAHYKVPSHVRFVSEFPLTVTGKAQKFLMREAMMRELGLREIEHA
jgi:fatty-acyl-CoA synthase